MERQSCLRVHYEITECVKILISNNAQSLLLMCLDHITFYSAYYMYSAVISCTSCTYIYLRGISSVSIRTAILFA